MNIIESDRPRSSPSNEMIFMQPHVERYFSECRIMVYTETTELLQFEKTENIMMSFMWKLLGRDVNADIFAAWVRDCCGNYESSNSLELARLFFDECLYQLGEDFVKKTWNLLGQSIYYCGNLPPNLRQAIYFFFIEFSKNRFNWKELFTEEDNDDSTGATLIWDLDYGEIIAEYYGLSQMLANL